MQIRQSTNKREQCSCDRWCCDVTLINQYAAWDFLQRALQGHSVTEGVGGRNMIKKRSDIISISVVA